MLVFVEGSRRRSANVRYTRHHPLRLFHQNQRLLARKFRMEEKHVKKICRLIAPLIGDRQTPNWSVDLENKVVIALRYLSTNAHQEVLTDTIGVSQKTVSNAVRDVVHALNNPLIVRHFIRCRLGDEEYCRMNAAAFARTGAFPNIIGAVDGSCIRLQKPAHSGWQYYCRKGFTALNVLAAVDAHGRFVYINANFPGSVHDASVYYASQVKYAYEKGSVPHGYSFIGDSGFANGNDIITPIRNPTTMQEVSYNRWPSKMRVIVECTFGIWKRKFAILKDKIRVAPNRAAKIIIACAVLHNMMIAMGCLRPSSAANPIPCRPLQRDYKMVLQPIPFRASFVPAPCQLWRDYKMVLQPIPFRFVLISLEQIYAASGLKSVNSRSENFATNHKEHTN